MAEASYGIRRATEQDIPGILELAHLSLGWEPSQRAEQFFRWKHLDNPFGPSPMWIAVEGEHVVGFRAFLRWQLQDSESALVEAARAVDTATHPSYQGRGIFRELTLRAVDELPELGIELIFNTPNGKSLPGYLKMGWEIAAELRVALRITRPSSMYRLAGALQPAALWSEPSDLGESAPDVFADRGVADLVASQSMPRRGLSTLKSGPFLAWRYGLRALDYRVVRSTGGIAVLRIRQRGRAREAVLCDVFAPTPTAVRELVHFTSRDIRADYIVRLGTALISGDHFIRVPTRRVTLVSRDLRLQTDRRKPSWNFSMGDIELF